MEEPIDEEPIDESIDEESLDESIDEESLDESIDEESLDEPIDEEPVDEELEYMRRTTKVVGGEADYMQRRDVREKYLGEWVGVVGTKVVAHGKDLGKTHAEARKLSDGNTPFMEYIPTPEELSKEWV